MSPRKRWVRVIRMAVVTIIVVLASLFAFVQIQQRLLQWWAERLLADIKQIQMGKSTWGDAQGLMSRWGKWGGYQNECDQHYCSYEISIDDISHSFQLFPFLEGGQWEPHLRWPTWINYPYRWSGGRFAVVEAGFEVRDGVVWAKSFAVRTAFSSNAYNKRRESYADPDSNVIGEGFCATHLSLGRFPESVYSIDAPEVSLSLTDNDHDGHWAVAAFTPFAYEDKVNILLSFNLDCITSMRECRTASQLMPTAVSIYKAGKRESNKSAGSNYLKRLPVWVAARDVGYVAIAQVIRLHVHAPKDIPTVNFQITKLLKGDSLISNHNSFYMVSTIGSKGSCSVSINDAQNLRNETSVLVFLDDPLNEPSTPETESSACLVLPRSDETLSAAERGIARYSVLYPAIWEH